MELSSTIQLRSASICAYTCMCIEDDEIVLDRAITQPSKAVLAYTRSTTIALLMLARLNEDGFQCKISIDPTHAACMAARTYILNSFSKTTLGSTAFYIGRYMYVFSKQSAILMV